MKKYIESKYIMGRISYFFVLISLFLSSISLQAKNNVIISEIMYDSPLNEQIATGIPYSNGEYVELFNAGVDSVNLNGWVLRGGGSTEIYSFTINTILAPKSYLIVAYQYNNSGFTLDQLYTGFAPDATHQVQYQRKIILSNSGESVYLRDNNGITKDSIYYDGNSAKTKPNRLSADNADGLAGNSCLSIQRKTASYDAAGKAIPNNLEWATTTANPFGLNIAYTDPAIPRVVDVAISSGQNYIVTVTPLDETSQVDISSGQITLHNDAKGIIGIQYFDGLGRPTETVQQGITPQKQDLLTFTEYDGVGRDYKHWLPTPVVGNKGAFVELGAFKSTAGTFYADSSFTLTHYEASPLNRVIGQQGPGDVWNKHYNKIDYQTNETSEVAYYSVTDNSQLKKDGFYDPNMLYKTETKDEDDKTAYEFKDKQGQVVLKQSVGDEGIVNTYYVYDDLGRLRYVIPPIAADSLTDGVKSNDDGVLRRYAYLYQYDERGNCIYKRLPGCEPIYMVYDKADRMVLSQDGNQRDLTRKTETQWTVTKYDALGRVVYTGIINSNTTAAEYKTQLANQVITESYDGSTGFYNTGYTCSGLLTGIKPLIVNYYDNYAYMKTLQGSVDTLKLTYDAGKESVYGKRFGSAKGLLTGTRTYLLDNAGTNFTASVMYYDYRGNVVQTHSSNHLGGYDRMFSQYNFSGKPTKTLKEHSISSTVDSPLPEVYTYTYDHAGRLLTTSYELNNKPAVVLAANTNYDELGRLKEKKRHTGADVEEFDYNIRNWATRIKSGAFEETLHYISNPIGSLGYYNGNISYSTWKYNNELKGYAYTYDKLNRLERAHYALNGQLTDDFHYYEETFQYDKMGNIRNLSRNDGDDTRDQLTLTYNGNQLKNVNDGYGSLNQYNVKEYQDKAQNDNNTSVEEMSYDTNGNLEKDLDRDIVTIRYNVLNLPDTVQFGSGNQIINKYDAGGKKLSTEYYTKISPLLQPLNTGEVYNWTSNPGEMKKTSTLYIGNIEYETSIYDWNTPVLNRVSNNEGYVDNFNVSMEDLRYNYYRRDHLGNNREVWYAPYNRWERNADQVGFHIVSLPAATSQRTQYYPSGLPWASNEGDNPDTQNKKYNGKEFVEMHGYDTYDYGARGMYAAIGRFTSVDPLAERHYNVSPYVYCGNNPVSFIDSNGMDSTYYNSQGNTIYKCGDDPNTNATFVVKTTETTDQMYKDSNPDQKGNSNPISTQDATTAENEIKDGNVTGDHMKNVAKMESQTQMESMVASIKDDGSHGTGESNNREYSGDFTANGVGNLKTSAVGDPSKGGNLVTQGDPNFHSHPSGTVRLTGATALWQQAPSKKDISTASRKHYEYTPGMGNGTIYIYNRTGVVATIPISTFKK